MGRRATRPCPSSPRWFAFVMSSEVETSLDFCGNRRQGAKVRDSSTSVGMTNSGLDSHFVTDCPQVVEDWFEQ
jgi:hypothetical protein